MPQRRLRVFQVATGNVGSEMVGRIVEHPDLELVGLYCYSPDKLGLDAGQIVGMAPLGVTAMTPKTEPSWDVQGCYITTVEGDPTIVNRHMIFPATGMPHGAWTPEYFASVGMTITGMPALNAIRSVCEAKPGLMTSADLPLRAFGARFHDAILTDVPDTE